MALKVPEEVTAEVFPRHPRYGPRAGSVNPSYLNADALRALFLEPLEPYRTRLGPLIFEFGARGRSPRDFVASLDPFLNALPEDFRYAVEVRNREYLRPGYFDSLRAHGVAHVMNAWTRMPELSEQVRLPLTADFTVVRALLRQGRPYDQAVERFAPYDKIQEENPEGRDALRALIRRMREEQRAAYIFVNNRFEGYAPETIRAVVEE